MGVKTLPQLKVYFLFIFLPEKEKFDEWADLSCDGCNVCCAQESA